MKLRQALKRITGDELRAARSYAKLSQKDLAEQAMVSENTIVRLEKFDDRPVVCVLPVLSVIVSVLATYGISITGAGAIRRTKKQAPQRGVTMQ